MKSHLSWQNAQTLERIFHQSPARQRSLKTPLNKVWQRAIAYFAASNEPHVWQTQDVDGKPVWNAYDPATHRSIDQVSAAELRIWLEERYYQDPLAHHSA